MEACKKNPSNHSFKYKLSFHADKEATYCSRSTVGATAGATRGWGRRAHTQGTAPASLFKGSQWAWWVSWARDRDRTPVSWVLLGRLWVRVYLKVQWLCVGEGPTGLSLREASRSRTGPDALGDVSVRSLIWGLIQENSLTTGQKCTSLEQEEAFLGQAVEYWLYGQEKVQQTLQVPLRILKVPIEQIP